MFSIAICRQWGNKWQLKTLFLLIFYLRSSIVLAFSIAAYPVRECLIGNEISHFQPKHMLWVLNKNVSMMTSKWDDSFEHPKHMFKLMEENNINFMLHVHQVKNCVTESLYVTQPLGYQILSKYLKRYKSPLKFINPFKLNKFSHSSQSNPSISVLKFVGWYFSILFKF